MSQRKQYLLEILLPEVAKAGRFGKGMKFIKCNNNEGKTGEQFASSVVFLNVVIGCDSDRENKQVQELKLVLKFFPDNVKIREVMNSEVQFSNEIAMYSEILPFLNFKTIVSDLFPHFYWGNLSNEAGIEPIVIIEDLKTKNFTLANHKVYLDFNHVVLVLKALGKFHALSYIMKQQKPSEFNQMIEKLREHIWQAGNDNLSVAGVIGPSALRGIKALNDIESNKTLQTLKEKLESDAIGLMKQFITPEEPTAVICHGDFCNHNMLFKYESDVPTAVKFIDLQTSRYASPVIDLSMILLLNVAPEVRSRHWDQFISIYYESVRTTVTNVGCVPPSIEHLQNDLRTKLFYGYFHCSYFLPMLVNEGPHNMDEAINLEPHVVIQHIVQMGGEKATQLLVSILKHLQEHNCFAFLD